MYNENAPAAQAIIINERIRSHIPPLRADELKQLEENLLRDGCESPLILWGDILVDGHNRYAICTKHGLPYKTEQKEFKDTDEAIAWAEENQLGRRNLTADQFAYFIGRKYARLKSQGARTDLTSGKNYQKSTAASKIATEHGISEKTVRNAADFARNVDSIADAIGESARSAILSGEDSLTRADVAEIAESAPSAADEGLVFGSAKEALAWAKVFRAEKAEVRRAERVEKIAAVCANNRELNTDIRYPIIYADPPWAWDGFQSESRHLDNHYPTLSVDEICRLEVGRLASESAVLFLWTTSPRLFEAQRVFQSWGFEYKSSFLWDKQKIGLGLWNRNQHEILLVCSRGSFPLPAPSTLAPSVVSEARTVHSRKPERFYQIIEEYYPDLPKIELFARQARRGWACWGNQAPAVEEVAA